MYFSGFNGFGQLEEHTEQSINKPINLKKSLGKDKKRLEPKDVKVTWSSILLLFEDFIIVHGYWGERSNSHTVLTLPQTISTRKPRKVSCTFHLLLVLTETGEVFKANLEAESLTWGLVISRIPMDADEERKFTDIVTNEHSVLALDSLGALHIPPVILEVPGVTFKQIACGKEHFVALSTDGVVYTWGSGSRGQLGNGSLIASSHPEPVSALQGLEVTQIAAGGWHSCAVTNAGDLYVWGWNESGQLGLPCKAIREAPTHISSEQVDCVSVQAEPRLLDCGEPFESGSLSVTSVSCGSRHTAIVLENGSGWTWGWNSYGQLGTGDLISRDTAVCVIDNVDKVVCGPWNTLWLK